MKRLGKNERAIVEFLKKQPDQAANTYAFESLSSNTAHFLKCIYPALKALHRRGIVVRYTRLFSYKENDWYWALDEDGLYFHYKKVKNPPAPCKGRRKTVWKLNNEEV